MVSSTVPPTASQAACSHYGDADDELTGAAEATRSYAVEGTASLTGRRSPDREPDTQSRQPIRAVGHGAPGCRVARSGGAERRRARATTAAGGELTWRRLWRKGRTSPCTAGTATILAPRAHEDDGFRSARAFAMHARSGCTRTRELGRGRYTLWPGDAGNCALLADCPGRRHLPALSSA